MKNTIEEFDRSLLLPVLASFDKGEDWSDPKWLDTEKEGDLPSHRISFQRRGRALCGGHTRNCRQHGAYCVLGSAAEAPLGRIARGLLRRCSRFLLVDCADHEDQYAGDVWRVNGPPSSSVNATTSTTRTRSKDSVKNTLTKRRSSRKTRS